MTKLISIPSKSMKAHPFNCLVRIGRNEMMLRRLCEICDTIIYRGSLSGNGALQYVRSPYAYNQVAQPQNWHHTLYTYPNQFYNELGVMGVNMVPFPRLHFKEENEEDAEDATL